MDLTQHNKPQPIILMSNNTHSLKKRCDEHVNVQSNNNKKQKFNFINTSHSPSTNTHDFPINSRPSLTFSLLSNPDSLNVATHNIVTFRDNIKNDQILQHALINNIHILGVSETNIPFKQISLIKKHLNPSYTYFFNSHKSSSKGNGVGLFVYNSIKDYIFYSSGNIGRYIFINLQL